MQYLEEEVDKESFVKRVDKNKQIVLLTSDEDLMLLSNNSSNVFCDGTFRYSPSFFQQMYTFFVLVNGYYIAVAFFLLQNKKSCTYERMLQILFEECRKLGLSLSIDTITIDFEQAMIKAIRKLLPSVVIRGCRFHLGQSWLRKIQSLGLLNIYKDRENNQGRWLKNIFGFPAVDSNLVRNLFFEYTNSVDCDEQIQTFINYLDENYLKDDSHFPPNMWASLLTQDFVSTNNGAEAFHRHFGDLFGYLKSNPDIFYFLYIMKEYQSLKKIKLNSSKPIKTSPLNEFKNDHNQLQLGLISIHIFLNKISKKMLPVRL